MEESREDDSKMAENQDEQIVDDQNEPKNTEQNLVNDSSQVGGQKNEEDDNIANVIREEGTTDENPEELAPDNIEGSTSEVSLQATDGETKVGDETKYNEEGREGGEMTGDGEAPGEGEKKDGDDDDDWDDDNPLTDELALECLEELQLNAAGNAYGYTIFNAVGKRITSLGKGFKKFVSLKLANLEHNRLRILDGFGSLTELLWINADHNLLESLPKLPQEKLQRIFANHNKLITLKKSESPSVEELHLSFNQIENIEGLPAWPNLKTIDLSHNDILSCKKCGGHPNLVTMNLSNNPSLGAFSGIGEFPNLKELYIDEIGEIASLDEFKTFFPSLEILSMKHNVFKIKLIQPLSELQNLKTLLMQECKICNMKNYRTEVTILVPQISILDDIEITEDDKIKAKNLQEEREEEARRKAEALAEAEAAANEDD